MAQTTHTDPNKILADQLRKLADGLENGDIVAVAATFCLGDLSLVPIIQGPTALLIGMSEIQRREIFKEVEKLGVQEEPFETTATGAHHDNLPHLQ